MKNKNILILSIFIFFIFISLITIFYPSDYSNIDYLNTTDEECYLDEIDIINLADIHYEQNWSADDGHKLKINILEIPYNNYIEIKENGNTIGKYHENKNISHEPENNDKIKIIQHSENKKYNETINKIKINDF